MSAILAIIKAYWDVMEPGDAQTVALSFLVTLMLGSTVVGGFVWYALYLDGKKTAARIAQEKAGADRVENAMAARAARQGRPSATVSNQPKAISAPVANAKAPAKNGTGAKVRAPLPTPSEKRYIPPASQQALVERAREQLADNKPDKALVTYLTLLYSAAENRDGSALPANLTECLRGAAECYRKLGQPENAVKFLQAERRVFEEVVVSAANSIKGDKQKPKGASILASLLNPDAANGTDHEDLPRRCQTLSDVAEACTGLGRHDVALAYRVKAAAVKQKLTGKALDERSPELIAMAAALAKVRDLGIGTDKALKEAMSGENAVSTDDPLLAKMLEDRIATAAAATAGPPAEDPSED